MGCKQFWSQHIEIAKAASTSLSSLWAPSACKCESLHWQTMKDLTSRAEHDRMMSVIFVGVQMMNGMSELNVCNALQKKDNWRICRDRACTLYALQKDCVDFSSMHFFHKHGVHQHMTTMQWNVRVRAIHHIVVFNPLTHFLLSGFNKQHSHAVKQRRYVWQVTWSMVYLHALTNLHLRAKRPANQLRSWNV